MILFGVIFAISLLIVVVSFAIGIFKHSNANEHNVKHS